MSTVAAGKHTPSNLWQQWLRPQRSSHAVAFRGFSAKFSPSNIGHERTPPLSTALVNL
jgi:hypothetical protein